jgi:anti-sigma factor RsiW
MHLDEERMQRLLHDELGAPAQVSVRDHLATCLECRSRLAEAEREEAWVFDRLRRLDHALPQVNAEALMSVRAPRASAWPRVAAGIFLALAAAGVAYAAPGSPLPRLLEQVIQWIAPGSQWGIESSSPPSSAPDSQAGIAIAPGDRLTIVFVEDRLQDTASVSLTDSSEVIVRALGGRTTFSSDNDRLVVGHQGTPAKFDILIPRAAPYVEVWAGDHRILLKEGSRIVTSVHPSAEGGYLLPLSRSEP